MSDIKQKEKQPPNDLFNEYQHLAPTTLQRLLGHPHNVAKSISLDYEDLLQDAYAGLWNACNNYDENKASFRTHAINHIRWAVMKSLNGSRSIKYNIGTRGEQPDYTYVSLNSPMQIDNDEGHMQANELISDDYDINQDIYNRLVVEELLSRLSDRDRKIMKMTAEGVYGKHIAEKIGISRQMVSLILKNIREQAREIKESVY